MVIDRAECGERRALNGYDRVTLFVCEQDGDRIIGKIKFKDNKRLDGVIPDHYRHQLFRSGFEKFPRSYRVCLVFQAGTKEHHKTKMVWVRNRAFQLDDCGEMKLQNLINEIEDKRDASRLNEELKCVPFD